MNIINISLSLWFFMEFPWIFHVFFQHLPMPGRSGAGHLCGELAGPKLSHGSEPGGTAIQSTVAIFCQQCIRSSWWFHGDLVGISWWFSGDIMVDLVGRWWDLLWYEWYFISTLDYGYILLFLKIHGYNPTLPWVCGISRADLLGIPRQPMGSKWRQQPGNDDRVERDDESQGRWNHQPKWYWLHKSIRVVSLFFPCGDSYVCKDIYIYIGWLWLIIYEFVYSI